MIQFLKGIKSNSLKGLTDTKVFLHNMILQPMLYGHFKVCGVVVEFGGGTIFFFSFYLVFDTVYFQCAWGAAFVIRCSLINYLIRI